MYIVLEIQKLSESSIAIPTPIYSSSDMNQAESEFHRVCSIAALSGINIHTVMLIGDSGFVYKIESYSREEPVVELPTS